MTVACCLSMTLHSYAQQASSGSSSSLAAKETAVSAYNVAETLKVTLHLPAKVRWARQPTEHRGSSPTPVPISITNVSTEGRYVYNVFSEYWSIHYENVGRGPRGYAEGNWYIDPKWKLIYDSTYYFSRPQFMQHLSPGESVMGNFHPESGWFFQVTPNGSYNVNIVYDDERLWPPNMKQHGVGRIVFPLTMTVSNECLSFTKRTPKRGEIGRRPEPWVYQCWPEKLPDYMKSRKLSR